MSNVPVIPLTFEQKLKNRLKESIGELLSDEDLSKMVARSMEEIFFTKRPNPKRSNYGYGPNEPEFLPPLLNEIVKECLTPAVNSAVKTWVEDHPIMVAKAVESVVTQGVGNAVISAMNTQFQGQLLAFQQNILQTMQTGQR